MAGFFDDALKNIGNFFGVNKQQQKKPVQTTVKQPTNPQSLRQQVGVSSVLPTVLQQATAPQAVQQIKSAQQVQQAKPAPTPGTNKVFPDSNATADEVVKAFNEQGRIKTNDGGEIDLSNPQQRENVRKMIQLTAKGGGTNSPTAQDKANAQYIQGKLDTVLAATAKQTAHNTGDFIANIAKTPIDVAQGAGKAAVRIGGGLANQDSVDVGPVGQAILGERKIKGISQYGSDIVNDSGKIIGKDWSGAPQWVKDAVGVAATVGDATPGVAAGSGTASGVKTGLKSGLRDGATAFSDASGVTKTTDAVSKLFTKNQPDDPELVNQVSKATGNDPQTVSQVVGKVQNDIPLTPNETKVANDVKNALYTHDIDSPKITDTEMADVIKGHRDRFGDENISLTDTGDNNVMGNYKFSDDMIRLQKGSADVDTVDHESVHKAIGQFLPDDQINQLYKDIVNIRGGKGGLVKQYKDMGYDNISWRGAAEEEIANTFIDYRKNFASFTGKNGAYNLAKWAADKNLPQSVVNIFLKLSDLIDGRYGSKASAAGRLDKFYEKLDTNGFNGAERRVNKYQEPSLKNGVMDKVIKASAGKVPDKLYDGLLDVRYGKKADEAKLRRDGTVSNSALGALAKGDAKAAHKILDASGVQMPKNAKNQLAEQLANAQSPAEAQDALAHAGIKTDAPATVKAKATTEDIQAANDAIERKMSGTATKADEKAINKVYGPAQKAKALDRATTAPGDRIPEAAIPENPAFKTNGVGEQVPIKNFGEAGAGGGSFQKALETSDYKGAPQAGPIGYFRSTEQKQRALREIDPNVAKPVDDVLDANLKAHNDATTNKNTAVDSINGATKGFSKKDWADTVATLEKSSKVDNPKAAAAAETIRPILQDIIDRINPTLESVGKQPIGRVEDYFPRMREMNGVGFRKDQANKMISEIFGSSTTETGLGKTDPLGKGFTKERTSENAVGKQMAPYKALVSYISQAEDLIHTAPVYRRAEALKNFTETANKASPEIKDAVLNVLNTFLRQYEDSTAKTAGQKIARGITNLTSRTQIAGSVSTLLSGVANPVFGAMDNAAKLGLLKGGAKSVAAVVEGAYHVPLARAGKIKEFANVDGVESQYLKSLISRNPAAKGAQKVQNAGYALSNFGDAPYRAGFLKQRFRTIVGENPNITKEEAVKQAERDTKNVFGSRVKGEKSDFTASPKAIPKLLSQYQVEQISNVVSFLDTVFNKKTPANRKLAAALTGLGAAYGANQLTSAISGGTIKPLPDLVGSFVDAFDKVDRMQEDRKNKGDKPLTDAQKVALVLSNGASNFTSNLPLGRTALSAASSVAQGLGVADDTATATGLTPRDTNPAQTLPAIGTITDTVGAIQKGAQGKDTLANTAVTVGTKAIPFGSQIRKSVQGVATFLNGGQTAQPTDAQKENGKPGTQKFTVNNDLSTTEGKLNLLQMALFGPYAGKGGQEYIKSGFQSQSDRDIANKKLTSEEVGNLTQDQANQYYKSVKTRFNAGLSDSDKKVNGIINSGQDEVKRQIEAGNITQDQVDHIKAQQNRDLYDNGLGYKIDTGYSKEDLNKLSDPEKAWVIQKAIDTKGLYDEAKETKESKAVVAEAMTDDNRWPTLDAGDFKSTNKLAKSYIDYQKKLANTGDDDSAKFEAQKAFWTTAVKGTYTDKDQSNYKLSIAQIKQMVGSDGLTINGKNYKLGKSDMDTMIAMDDKLLKAGLIATPKFSNKTRRGFGYPDAPDSDVDGLGYTDTSKAKGSGGGRSGDTVNSHAGDFLTNTTVSPLFKQSSSDGVKAAPKADFGKFRNTAGVARGSSIKIKL